MCKHVLFFIESCRIQRYIILFLNPETLGFQKNTMRVCPYDWYQLAKFWLLADRLYPLFPCYDFVSQMWGWLGGGGGGVMFFSHFMLFPTFIEKKIWEYKTSISHLMFSFFLYAGNIEKCPFTYSYWLNGRWFLPNSRYREFYHEIGNIEKCPFTYWLNRGGGFSKS